MDYLSTRGRSAPAPFRAILLEGLRDDGGLAMPEHYPRLGTDELARLRGLSYADLATEIVGRFATDWEPAALSRLVSTTYSAARFGTPDITPLTPLDDGLHLLGLSNGPTLAFKDLALQLLGNLFEAALADLGGELNILGATSGDTGSAAEYALRGKARIRVFMLSPRGRMSAFQTAQMYSLADPNIFNLSIEGVFDDAQDIVKAVSGDADFKSRHHIGTVNSINWARIVAQVVYYFKGYFAATRDESERVSFTVPSGNFGNICAGHIARMMGLPIARLVCATNENDVLDEFFTTGVYRVRSSAETRQTSSPSMDISKASNFERFVFDLVDRDSARVRALWQELAERGAFDLGGTRAFGEIEERFGFVSGKSTHADRLATIRDIWQRHGRLVDPHTADAIHTARRYRRDGEPMLVLETAQPVKFAATIEEAVGFAPPLPAAWRDLYERPQHCVALPASAEAVKAFIAAHAGGAPGVAAPHAAA